MMKFLQSSIISNNKYKSKCARKFVNSEKEVALYRVDAYALISLKNKKILSSKQEMLYTLLMLLKNKKFKESCLAAFSIFIMYFRLNSISTKELFL